MPTETLVARKERIVARLIVPMSFVLTVVVLATGSLPAAGFAILYVDDDQATPSTADGTTWVKAYRDLRLAIQKATTQPATYPEIRVAKGRYPTTQSTTQPAESFHLLNSVSIRGGYRGLSDLANADVRDIVRNETILTGDLNADDAGNFSFYDENAYCVVDVRQPNGTATNNTALLEGFTITGGNGGGGSLFGASGSGAGIYCPGVGDSGGPSTPTISLCRIRGNRLMEPSLANTGAGMYVSYRAAPVIRDCVFENNLAAMGAGLYLNQPNNMSPLERCRFDRNFAEVSAGGVYVFSPDQSQTLRFVNCSFTNNVAESDTGGGLFQITSGSGQLELDDCLFARNVAFIHGGGVEVSGTNTIKLINCTLFGNRALFASDSKGGGLYLDTIFGGSPTATLGNCIAWNNTAGTGNSTSADAQIGKSGGTLTPTYCSITNWSAGGTGNNATDPVFISEPLTNLRLKSTSPSINNGDTTTSQPAGLTEDLDRNPRTVGGTVDRGPYEFSSTITDCNTNGIADSSDISAGRSADCNTNGIPDECDIANDPRGDCDGDGIPNDCDGLSVANDCNMNCVADSSDIGSTSTDCNGNSKPDDCEFTQPLVCTTNPSFDRGYLINVNHSTANQLERNTAAATKPAPYVWIVLSKQGDTVARINAAATTGADAIVGEYRTAPRWHVDTATPSLVGGDIFSGRVAVDLDGSIWVGNEEDQINNESSATKIGLVVGGTRVNEHGAADATGQYLKGPFQYCTCEDRDGDGLIKTSRGEDNVLAWENYDGRDDARLGPVYNAEDECIIRYSGTRASGIRLVAIDANNDVWVGGTSNRIHQKIIGASGAADGDTDIEFSNGGFNGLLDCQPTPVLWSATNGGPLVRYPIGGSPSDISVANFDVAINLSGYIWVTDVGSSVRRVSPAGSLVQTVTLTGEGGSSGVTVSPSDGDVWVSNTGSGGSGKTVTRLSSSGSTRKEISLGATAQNPTGIAVDSFGKVWVSCFGSQTIKRIAPDADSDGLGAVDLTVSPTANPGPESYGDLTGMTGLRTTATGTWEIVHDGVVTGTQWRCIRWNTEGCVPTPIPSGTSIAVGIRAADERLALTTQPYTPVTNDSTLSGIQGRFVEVRARLRGSCPEASFVTPVLCDLQVRPLVSCVKGNCNHDAMNKVNGDDIQAFVRVLLGATTCLFDICPADMNNSGTVTSADIPCFITRLLNPSGPTSCDNISPCGGSFEEPNPRSGDCNTNGIADDNDITDGTSPDCNHNFIPDECDIATGDPDGNELVSNDLNTDGVPDECQPDCNTNGVPDDKDIAVSTSYDVNANGVPDECEPDCNTNGVPDDKDIADTTSADCNSNGIPDECDAAKFDCNSNGVPDDCDLDPTDPDGNEAVSQDCNTNGLPDECDFDLTWFPSYDCNENGIPDECDIAEETSADCNTNGIPDECDIEAETSEDANTNGIPDECEEEHMMMGGGGGEGDGPASSPYDNPAWEDFWQWQSDNAASLAAMSPWDRFKATIDKLVELGLPAAIPWAKPVSP